MKQNESSTTSINIPAAVGYWVISDSIMWGVYKKHPNWFHRKITKLILGWDYKKNL